MDELRELCLIEALHGWVKRIMFDWSTSWMS